jgi:hypothetical protein
MTASQIRRYSWRRIILPSGQSIRGTVPGLHRERPLTGERLLSDQLGQQVGGILEAGLPYGRADVLTSAAVFEVESYPTWRTGVRQVLAYAAQTGLSPQLALFGAARGDEVLSLYLQLRDGSPAIALWWYSHGRWQQLSRRSATGKTCR